MSKRFNDSRIQFLPLSRFHQFANLALHQIALKNAEMTDVELAVQVIGLVEKSAGKQVVADFLKPISVRVLSAHRSLAGTRDRFAKFGDAEAPLIQIGRAS